MLEELKSQVCEANLRLAHEGLAVQTWGNASGIDRASGLVVIKPSGVSYVGMTAAQMVVVELISGKVVEGNLNPSTDTATHLELYRSFSAVGGIAHTHSLYATAWAQAQRDIPMLGTTQADYFAGPVPCTRPMTAAEIEGDYERNTGQVIVECFANRDPLHTPAVLVSSHGPFAWGPTVAKAVDAAACLEYVAHLAILAQQLNPGVTALDEVLHKKHFFRKHGQGAYYGQPEP
ncbi:MAG: L-ribulose-5-phosphate 4-epimerase AraD [Acidimicrobiia bacterium]|nr:L-ribulose-5-phosphate 4-epimerase AraD [Acidimicrobiia bacterium]